MPAPPGIGKRGFREARRGVSSAFNGPPRLMSIPRSASKSSTLRSDSGYRTYGITTRRMTSGELLKYRNGLLMARSYHGQRRREH
jgi:hypothetical protein